MRHFFKHAGFLREGEDSGLTTDELTKVKREFSSALAVAQLLDTRFGDAPCDVFKGLNQGSKGNAAEPWALRRQE